MLFIILEDEIGIMCLYDLQGSSGNSGSSGGNITITGALETVVV